MHRAFLTDREAKVAQRERDAGKKGGDSSSSSSGAVRRPTGIQDSASNMRVSYAAAALITGSATQSSKRLKVGGNAPGGSLIQVSNLPGFKGGSDVVQDRTEVKVASSSSAAASTVTATRRTIPKKVNFETLQVLFVIVHNFLIFGAFFGLKIDDTTMIRECLTKVETSLSLKRSLFIL
jgi:hypothetical protein